MHPKEGWWMSSGSLPFSSNSSQPGFLISDPVVLTEGTRPCKCLRQNQLISTFCSPPEKVPDMWVLFRRRKKEIANWPSYSLLIVNPGLRSWLIVHGSIVRMWSFSNMLCWRQWIQSNPLEWIAPHNLHASSSKGQPAELSPSLETFPFLVNLSTFPRSAWCLV